MKIFYTSSKAAVPIPGISYCVFVPWRHILIGNISIIHEAELFLRGNKFSDGGLFMSSGIKPPSE